MKRILIFLFAAALFLCGCRRTEPPAFHPELPVSAPPPETTVPVSESEESPAVTEGTGQLLYLTESKEEAEEIAKLYNMELVRHLNGLALYRTEEDPVEVIRRGSENGWPELSLNGTVMLH